MRTTLNKTFLHMNNLCMPEFKETLFLHCIRGPDDKTRVFCNKFYIIDILMNELIFTR